MGRQELPTPEELFGDKTIPREQAVSTNRQAIPEYRIRRTFSLGFVLVLIVLVALLLNLDRLGIHTYSMLSSSMGEVVPEGSLVVCKDTDPQILEVGDVITYEMSDNVFVTHMIDEVVVVNDSGELAFVTKGTENRGNDAQAVSVDMLRGKMLFYIPYIGQFFKK